MAIIPINKLPIAEGFGENDTLILNTENDGVKLIKAGDVGGNNEEPQSAFVVSLTLDENTGTYNSDKTGAEIYEAWSNGIPTNIRFVFGEVPVEAPAVTVVYDPNNGYQVAGGASIAMQGSRSHEIQFFTIMGMMNSGDDTGPWSLDVGTEQLLPQPSTPTDDGKFLVADSNGWGMQRVDTSKSLVVTLTEVSGQEDVYSANKTASEIYNAWTSGLPVYFKQDDIIYPLTSADYGNKYSFTADLTYVDKDMVTTEMFSGEFSSGFDTSGWEYIETTVKVSGILPVYLTENDNTGDLESDKTPAEIYEAYQNGSVVVLFFYEVYCFLSEAEERQGGGYNLEFAASPYYEDNTIGTVGFTYTDKSGEEGWSLKMEYAPMLPEVESKDIGSVLMVESDGDGGARWSLANTDDFVVEFSITPGDPFVVTSETTFAQIYAAYQNGENIRGVSELTGVGDVMLQLAHISDTTVVFFAFIEMTAGSGIYMTVRGTSSGYTAYTYQ